MRRTKKTKKTRMQGHMAVAISMAMAAGLALTGMRQYRNDRSIGRDICGR
mgnify:CR=1 FL=1